MESNTSDTFNTQSTGSTTNATSGGFSRDVSADAAGVADRARSAADTATDKLADVGSSVRERAGNLKNSLADALESGAEKLRAQSSGSGQLASASAADGSSAMVADETNRLAQTGNQLAGGLQASADWLREADIDGIKSGIERQVREHPARSLAVAVGLGYLLGKAFRK